LSQINSPGDFARACALKKALGTFK